MIIHRALSDYNDTIQLCFDDFICYVSLMIETVSNNNSNTVYIFCYLSKDHTPVF